MYKLVKDEFYDEKESIVIKNSIIALFDWNNNFEVFSDKKLWLFGIVLDVVLSCFISNQSFNAKNKKTCKSNSCFYDFLV